MALPDEKRRRRRSVVVQDYGRVGQSAFDHPDVVITAVGLVGFIIAPSIVAFTPGAFFSGGLTSVSIGMSMEYIDSAVHREIHIIDGLSLQGRLAQPAKIKNFDLTDTDLKIPTTYYTMEELQQSSSLEYVPEVSLISNDFQNFNTALESPPQITTPNAEPPVTITIPPSDDNEPPPPSDDNPDDFTNTVSESSNQAPIIGALQYNVNQFVPDGGTIGTVQASDPDADPITYSLVSGNGLSLFTINSTTGVLSVANADAINYLGGQTYTVVARVTDPSGATAEAPITINVARLNQVPTANPDNLITNEDTPLVISENVLTANDNDPNPGTTLSVLSIDGSTTTGTVQLVNGVVTYTPAASFQSLAAGQSVIDMFTYVVTDEIGLTDTATVTVTVNGVNDNPTTVDDVGNANEDGLPVVIDVLANDSDIDSPSLTVSAVNTAGTLGSVINNGTNVTYDPNGQFESLAVGETATDTFSYTASDGNGGFSTASVTVTITGSNDGPTAVADVGAADEDGPAVAINVLSNDTDPDTSDVLTVSAVNTAGTLGSVINNGTNVTYDPNGQFESLAVGETATDTFSYTASDGNGGFSTASVTVTITGINDAPVANDDSNDVAEDGTLVAGGTVTTNDTDVDNGSSFSVTAVAGLPANVGNVVMGTYGSVTIASNGVYSYTLDNAAANVQALAATQTVIDSFSYQITDDQGATATANLNITVTGANDAPTAGNDAQPIPLIEDANLPSIFQFADTGASLFVNDTDIDTLDTLTVTNVAGSVSSSPSFGGGTYGNLFVDSVSGLNQYSITNTNPDIQALAEGQVVTDVFTYTISDGNGGTDTATVTYSIQGVNDAPIAVNDSYVGATEDTIFNINAASGILANDTDVDTLDTLTVTSPIGMFTSLLGADVTLLSDGSFTYDPTSVFIIQILPGGQTTNDSFNYTITDGIATDTAHVTINVLGVDDPMVLVADNNFLTEDDVFPIYPSPIGNDFDTDSGEDVTFISLNTTGAIGLVTDLGGGDFQYEPGNNFNYLSVGETAQDVFTYTAQDAHGATATQTVTMHISGVNDPVTAVADTPSVSEDNAGTLVDVLANDLDPDLNDTLTISGLNLAGTTGLVTNNGTDVTYNPNGQFESLAVGETAVDSFSYTVDDGNGSSDVATVTVTITGENDVPVADNDGYNASEDAVLNVNAALGVLNGDTDVDTSDTLTVIAFDAASASGAVVNVNADGSFSYDPTSAATIQALNTGVTLNDTFDYTVSDGNGGVDTATVTVTVTGVNDAPDAVDDGYATDEDTALNIGVPGVLNNDTDAESHGLTVTAFNATSVNGATVNVNANGSFSYDPTGAAAIQALDTGVTLDDTFTYTIDDSNGGTDTATVTVTLTGINDAPDAVDDANATNEDSVINAGAPGVLVNDSDPESHGITVTAFDATSMSGATVNVNANGSYSYDPTGAATIQALNTGQTLNDTFTYTIDDGNTGTDTATVTINVTGINDAPDAVDDGYATDENAVLNEGVPGVLVNDTDAESQGLTVTGFDAVSTSGAAVTVNGNGSFSYDPTGSATIQALTVGQTLNDTFTYTIDDSNGGTDTATVTVTVTGVNFVPDAMDDSDATNEDTPLNIAAPGVLVNDTDPDGHTLTVTVFDAASVNGATVNVNGDGSFTYDSTVAAALQALAVGQTLNDTFTYTVDDGNGGTDTATVTITVTGVNDAPTAVDDTFDTVSLPDPKSKDAGNVVTNDSDIDTGDTFSVTSFDATSVNGATVTVDASGNFTYDAFGTSFHNNLTGGQTAVDTFTYTITDSQGATDSATVSVTVVGFDELVSTTLTNAVGFTLNGIGSDDALGGAVGVGDYNGDGILDIIVNARGVENTISGFDDGEAYIVYGGATRVTGSINKTALGAGTQGFVITGDVAVGGTFANEIDFAVAGLGDVNGDGIGDMLVSYTSTIGTNVGRVIFGQSTILSAETHIDDLSGFTIEDNLNFGNIDDAQGLGDVNGDGIADFAMTTNNGGNHFVIFGSTSFGATLDVNTVNGTNGFEFEGTGETATQRIANLGDINGDGLDDIGFGTVDDGNTDGFAIVYGSTSAYTNPLDASLLNGTNGIFIDVVDAGADLTDVDFEAEGNIVGAGDVNGDGYNDIFVTTRTPNAENDIVGYVIYGGPSLTSMTPATFNSIAVGGMPSVGFAVIASAASELTVSGSGDVNGDGYSDLILVAPLGDEGLTNAGDLYVIYGSANITAPFTLNGVGSNIDGFNGYVINGDTANERFGRDDIAGANLEVTDFDGDGYDDIILGSPESPLGGGPGKGELFVIYGSNTNGIIDFEGTSGADALTGNVFDNHLVAMQGDDTLDGQGGNDVYRAGAGDDTLIYDAADTTKVDGGAGLDTLQLSGSGEVVDLTSINNLIHEGIEVVDITGTGNNTLTLGLSDVFDLSTEINTFGAVDTPNTLIVQGNTGDVLNIETGAGWQALGTINVGGEVYQHVQSLTLVGDIYYDTDITQNFV